MPTQAIYAARDDGNRGQYETSRVPAPAAVLNVQIVRGLADPKLALGEYIGLFVPKTPGSRRRGVDLKYIRSRTKRDTAGGMQKIPFVSPGRIEVIRGAVTRVAGQPRVDPNL